MEKGPEKMFKLSAPIVRFKISGPVMRFHFMYITIVIIALTVGKTSHSICSNNEESEADRSNVYKHITNLLKARNIRENLR